MFAVARRIDGSLHRRRRRATGIQSIAAGSPRRVVAVFRGKRDVCIKGLVAGEREILQDLDRVVLPIIDADRFMRERGVDRIHIVAVARLDHQRVPFHGNHRRPDAVPGILRSLGQGHAIDLDIFAVQLLERLSLRSRSRHFVKSDRRDEIRTVGGSGLHGTLDLHPRPFGEHRNAQRHCHQHHDAEHSGKDTLVPVVHYVFLLLVLDLGNCLIGHFARYHLTHYPISPLL